MSRPDPISARSDPPPFDGRALTLQQIAVLTRLTGIGMEIAEGAVHAPDPALTFSRVARAVRLTIALQSRLAKHLAGLDSADDLARTIEAAKRRERIHRQIERAIETDLADDEDEIERLSADAWERLEEEDDAVIAEAPAAEIVARIRRDLGLPPEWGADLLSPSMGERPGAGVWPSIGPQGTGETASFRPRASLNADGSG